MVDQAEFWSDAVENLSWDLANTCKIFGLS